MSKNGFFFKALSCFLCLALILLTGGFSTTMAGGKEKSLLIGEMVSRGEVKFEAREKVWKEVEPSYFPVFSGVKIKTEKGTATISLATHNQVEMGQNSIISFDQKEQLRLYRGRVDFRISHKKDLSLRVGNLTVIGTPHLQAAQSPAVISPGGEEAIGSLFLHSNGSVTIKSAKGKLLILNQDRKVLTALSPKDSLTIPSAIVEKSAGEKAQPVMMAQVGEEEIADEPEKHMGLTGKTWGTVGLAALGAAGIIAVAGGGGGGGSSPVCP
ncbi:MAG: FecR domain-containing protein [Deltaproteobacteria bacterium]|nr:FecR domain-containing protein [Deltaproteobacteria bacterium]